MNTQPIASLDDLRVAVYRNVKDFDLRGEHGLFMSEGRNNVRCLIEQSRFRPHSVFVTPSALAGLRGSLERLGRATPVYVAEQETLNGVVGYNLHRGCLAAGECGDALPPAGLVRPAGEDSMLVALEQLTNPENTGSLFRSALAFGADGVLLCPRSCDPLYRKAIRVSMGGTLRLPFARAGSLTGALSELREAGYRILALHPDAASQDLSQLVSEDCRRPRRTVLLLGTEGTGLGAAALAAADRHVRVEMVPGVDSINVATAAAIALYLLSPARPRAS